MELQLAVPCCSPTPWGTLQKPAGAKSQLISMASQLAQKGGSLGAQESHRGSLISSKHHTIAVRMAARAAQHQQAPQHHPAAAEQQSAAAAINVSKRQLLAFGCSCCLSLYTQQCQPASAYSGSFSYAGAQGPGNWPGACSSGLQQSPIDISLQQTACDSRPPPVFRCVNMLGWQQLFQAPSLS